MNFDMRKVIQQLRFYQQCVKKVILRVICLYFGNMSQIINDQNIYMLNASNKTWINENDIVEELPFPDDMRRKPIQIWFWAMTDRCIMYWKSDCF